MTLTQLALTPAILGRHAEMLAQIVADGIEETCRKNEIPYAGSYADDFFSSRFAKMLDTLRWFLDERNRDPKYSRLPGALVGFTIGGILRPEITLTRFGSFEKLLIEWQNDPATRFAIWALGELGMKARIVVQAKISDDGSFVGELNLQVDE